MLGRRKLAIQSLIVLAALACGGPSPAPGPLVSVTKAAAKTAPADMAFDAFIFDLNLQKTYGARADEIQAQLKSSRADVNAKVKPVRLMSYSARQGVLLASETDVIMPLLFASTLADALDPVTAGRTTGGQTPSAPLTSTSDGPTTTTTTFLNTTTQLGGSGSKVTLTMHWTYRETTVDKATGANLVDLSDDRTMVGTIDVCPSAAGVSPATIDVHIQLSASAGGGTKTRSSTSSNTFSGHVDDQAVLRHVTQDAQLKTSWQSDSGSGGYDVNLTNANWQASESGVGSGVDSSAVGGSLTPNGAATADQVTKGAGETIAIDKAAIDPAYNQAQKLWRNGRCVVIQVPDYTAETPISISQQNSVQHDKEVDIDSLTKFGVSQRHRFGGGLNQPVKASLSGDKKLEPTNLQSGSGSLAYTAPGEPDKQASVTLKSASKRGIGTLVLAFHTKGKHLELSVIVTNTVTLLTQPGVTVQLVWRGTIGPADFHKVDDTTWEAAAPSKASGTLVGLPASPDCPVVSYSDTGTITFVATRDTRAGKSVWVLHTDKDRSSTTQTVSACGSGATVGALVGGWTLQALIVIGEIVLPGEGGTVTLNGSSPGPPLPQVVSLTFTATVTEK